MEKKASNALFVFYQRGLTTREQLLTEILRVFLVKEVNTVDYTMDSLFSAMKDSTEDLLGFFPADREDFFQIYQEVKEYDLLDLVLEIYKDDRNGEIISPSYLIEYFQNRIRNLSTKAILITEAERHLVGLHQIMDACNGTITLTTQNKLFELCLNILYKNHSNVSIRLVSIYAPLIEKTKYDYILCLPAFGGKVQSESFLTRDYDGVALESMTDILSDDGTLDIITSAKITFASLGYENLRKKIINEFSITQLCVLPEGIFRPWTSIKTYFLSITAKQSKVLTIGEFQVEENKLLLHNKQKITTERLETMDDWRIEFFLSSDNKYIKKFKQSNIPKVKLGDVAEVFRGKSILKKDTSIGDIAVLNISNIENGRILYETLETISENERKIKRYELKTGDVVLSCRGTAIKSAVFHKQECTVIASANIMVIRLQNSMLPSYIKMFFESPTGQVVLKSFQRGSTVMNLNHLDIMEMELPLLPIEKQQKLSSEYEKEQQNYLDTILQAEKRLEQMTNKLFNEMI